MGASGVKNSCGPRATTPCRGPVAPIEISKVALASRAELDRLAASTEKMLVDFIADRRSIAGTGQDNGGGGNLEINERRAAISVLMSRYDSDQLRRVLPTRAGKIFAILRDDISWLERAERQELAPGRAFDLGWSKNGTSTPRVLSALAERRAQAAEAAAQTIARDPLAAYDAGNACLLGHLSTDHAETRSKILADTLIQFRARRRSADLMDRRPGGQGGEIPERDHSEGRIASSGPIAALEQRLACQELPRGRGLEARRERALLRLVVANHPHASTNGIFWARNCAALLAGDRFLGRQIRNRPAGEGEGLNISLYDAIHKNYSANTPRVVDHFVRHRVFTGGEPAARLPILSTCIEAASDNNLVSAKNRLARLEEAHGAKIAGAAAAKTTEELQRAIFKYLGQHTDIPALKKIKAADLLFAYQTILDMHAAVANARPSDVTLEKNLFYAGEAWPDVARVIHAMRAGDHEATVEALGRARMALAKTFEAAPSGFDRQMLLRVDRQLELISAEVLGVAVQRADGDLGATLRAITSALRGTIAGGLESLRWRKKTAPVPELSELLGRAEKLLAQGRATAEEVRDLAADVFRSGSEVAEAMRGFFHHRESAIYFSGIDVTLDPELNDNLVKESSLHYLIALAQSAMNHGLEAEVSASRISFVSGMRVLSSVGPTVYKRVLAAKDLEQLLRLGPTKDDFCIVHHLDEKKMVAVGGLLADTKDAPGGYSHLSVFAKGHGISAIALPELAKNYGEFFANVKKGGGLYVDDRQGSFVMMPLEQAIGGGLVDREKVDALRPGFNQKIKYFAKAGDAEKLIESHEVHLSDQRSTRTIELYVPELEKSDPALGRTQNFAELAAMPFPRTRHLIGEKGAVLARLAESPALRELGVSVPGGAGIPPYEVASLLAKAGIKDRWMSVWMQDPVAGEVTADNFLESKFYTDREYRLGRAKEMRRVVEKGLRELLIRGGKPTREGEELLAALEANPDLRASKSWIARSSFTGEDRPNKSGAGQYESYPNLKTKVERLEGIVGVITSAWGDTPIENNVQMQIDLRHIWPSIVVEACIDADLSGVAVSRGPKGELGEISYQAVEGFGGGVAGGRPEEGTIGEKGTRDLALLAGKKKSLLSAAQQEQLRKVVLAIEKEFHQVIEPGRGYAVDVEWAIAGGKLHIVQARVITSGAD